MGFKCPCCKKNQVKTQNFADKLEEEQRRNHDRDKRIQDNYRILRTDLYEGIMKKFFSTGRDYKMFAKINLD
jgi:hypothetical protein